VKLRDKFLSNTDALGHFAGIPVITQTVNAVNHTAAARGMMEKALGVDKDAWLPDFAARKFRSAAKKISGVAGCQWRAYARQGSDLRHLLREFQ